MSAAGATIPNNLTIVIFDHAHVPRWMLISAAREGRRVFRAAGVETDWILCNPLEGCYVPERFVQVQIVSQPPRSTSVSSSGLGATTVCTATEHCSASYVFYNRILNFADDVSSAPDITLAYVMVHEIGHVLGLGHRPGSIMTAAFTPEDLRRASSGWFSFAQDDVREIRTAITHSRTKDPSRHIKLPGWHGELAE